MQTLKMAIRNIFRYKRRSFITLLSVASGVTGIILFGGFIDANYIGLRESVIRSQYGHFQIFKEGYEKNYRKSPSDYRISKDMAKEIDQILEETPGVELSTRRLEFTGLLSNGFTTEAAIVRGSDLENEALINSALTIISGNDLMDDELDGALLGEGLANALEVKVGDDLSLLTSTESGSMNGIDIKVAGIFRSFAKEYDDRAMIMPIQQAFILLDTSNIDKIVVLLSETNELDGILRDFKEELINSNLSVELKAWSDLASFYHKVVDLYDSLFLFINIVVIVIVLLGITNTITMSVMERTTDIGTLRAMGTRRSGIIYLFLSEGLLLGLLGGIIGILSGIFLSHYITSLGIMMPPPPGSSQGFPLRVEYVPVIWLKSFLLVWFAALISSVFPAIKASRLQIVDALRYV